MRKVSSKYCTVSGLLLGNVFGKQPIGQADEETGGIPSCFSNRPSVILSPHDYSANLSHSFEMLPREEMKLRHDARTKSRLANDYKAAWVPSRPQTSLS